MHPELVGVRLVSKWIERHYPTFCRSLGLRWWPSFAKFAAELKGIMPRRRCEVRRGGKRIGTVTAYLVPDPAAAVVDLSVKRSGAAAVG